MNKLSAQHVEIFSKAILESETDDTAYMRWHYPLLVHLRKAQSPNRFPYNKNQAHHKTAYLLFDEDITSIIRRGYIYFMLPDQVVGIHDLFARDKARIFIGI